jgi:ubiquinone/menaquinone biosynthesis C-methylase UbiE
LVSQVYERGWRQGFSWGGFPGADTEFRYALEYLQPHFGSTIVDMSCGSGLFTRRFAACGKFDGVIAADFSESMLDQTDALIRGDGAIDAGQVLLLRADIGRLPFATASVDAIHAGAPPRRCATYSRHVCAWRVSLRV